DYPHLHRGGTNLVPPEHGNVAQPTSPPQSARAVATWLLTAYANDTRMLQSLELLISDPLSAHFNMPDGRTPSIGRATFAGMDKAVKDWKERGDSNAENLMVFFFCGHGVASGLQTTLLMEDFGHEPDSPLSHAVDFNQLYLGMDKCEARDQCFFVDACRVVSDAVLTAHNFFGIPILYGSSLHASVPRRAPIYYSTVPGARAFGRTGAPSFFTDTLLKALEGAGGDDLDGGWWIQTDVLNRGIDYLLRRSLDKTAAQGQLSEVSHLVRRALHQLAGPPIVPVEVACQPDAWNQYAMLSFAGDAQQGQRDPPEEDDWEIELQMGRYVFSAELLSPQNGKGS